MRRNLSEWQEIRLPHYVKMFDPTNRETDKEDDEDNGSEDARLIESIANYCSLFSFILGHNK